MVMVILCNVAYGANINNQTVIVSIFFLQELVFRGRGLDSPQHLVPVDLHVPVNLREVMHQELAPGLRLSLKRSGHNRLGRLRRGGGVVIVLGDLAVI